MRGSGFVVDINTAAFFIRKEKCKEKGKVLLLVTLGMYLLDFSEE